MPRMNVIKTIESIDLRRTINHNYSISSEDVETISEYYPIKNVAIMKAFFLGYTQALKAQKAEAKRKAKAVHI